MKRKIIKDCNRDELHFFQKENKWYLDTKKLKTTQSYINKICFYSDDNNRWNLDTEFVHLTKKGNLWMIF